MTSLLNELQFLDDAQVMRAEFRPYLSRTTFNYRSNKNETSCILCKQAARINDHFLSACNFHPEQDRRYLAKSRQADCDDCRADEV